MTVAQITRGIRMRKHAWGKPTQQIADEAGVDRRVVVSVLRDERVSDAAYTLLTSYLSTPAGPWALINNRRARASKTGARAKLEGKLRRLTFLAVEHGVRVLKSTKTADMTVGQLRAYYWRIDWKTKEKIIEKNLDVTSKYILPDCLEAWEWIERITLLRDRLTISGKSQSAAA